MLARNYMTRPVVRSFARRQFGSSGLRLAQGEPLPVPTSPPQPKKRSSFIRRVFRLIGLSTLAGSGYLAYSIWDATRLPDQRPADVTKPRLVILGSGWGAAALLKTLDFTNYNVTVVSPRNYFLFTPLLPSCATGAVEHRSIMEPTRAILRKKSTTSTFVEGEVTKIDPYARKITVTAKEGASDEEAAGIPHDPREIPFDKLVIAVGSDVSTFGIPGVTENGCFLKEVEDSAKIRKRIMDCMEAASFPGLDETTRKRLLHTVVVGGGPTGVEFAGELYDFYHSDLSKFIGESTKDDFKVTLVEALPNVLNSFSKLLIDYTEAQLKEEHVEVMTNTAVNKVTEDTIYAVRTEPNGTKTPVELPYGTFVWAGGVRVRKVVSDLFHVIPEQAHARRGLDIDAFLQVKGTHDIYAVGDCAAIGLAPTAQVATQEGSYLGQLLNKQARFADYEDQLRHARDEKELRLLQRRLERLSKPQEFKYTHQGQLAYIGSDKAVADLSWKGQMFSLSGRGTFIFWRSAYLSMSFSLRNKLLVGLDWLKVSIFGRDVSRE